ncbi:unnamed protein product [Oncorhynchus mykiss]|uniref:Uncharacterized protein n=1 Tax=Oncorhynchus mykiss TaxID=8022 RepID=A0A060Y5M0_ONCMY|nr:unnamed protein product [Oncorhynchus mykiss]
MSDILRINDGVGKWIQLHIEILFLDDVISNNLTPGYRHVKILMFLFIARASAIRLYLRQKLRYFSPYSLFSSFRIASRPLVFPLTDQNTFSHVLSSLCSRRIESNRLGTSNRGTNRSIESQHNRENHNTYRIGHLSIIMIISYHEDPGNSQPYKAGDVFDTRLGLNSSGYYTYYAYSHRYYSPPLVMPSPQHFDGQALVSWSDLDVTIAVPWYMGLMFRTRQGTGTLMRATAGDFSTVNLLISDQYVRFEVFLGSERVALLGFPQVRVNDGEWHHVLVELQSVKDGKDIKYMALVSLDYGLYERSVEIGNELPGLRLRALYLGGLPGEGNHVHEGFTGCIQGVRMGETSTNVVNVNMLLGFKIHVEDGCDLADPCDSNICPENSHCSDDWSAHTCVCDPGYFGRECVDACHLNPCEHVSTCVRKPSSSHGYTCECGQNYYGQYCQNKVEKPCPRGWWGNPMCGPCHCDVSKGFDPDCNKTSGECRCKDNYYQPKDEDTCYPCECFPLGAHSRTCDPHTGQCPCKAGVIGQQCNRCDNPFAEVTATGCEVVYEGCPKAFDQGIWWPKTKFGRPAAMNCPKGSIGTAIRHCNDEKGWLPPELFNCTTVSFTQLMKMVRMLDLIHSSLTQRPVLATDVHVHSSFVTCRSPTER